MDGATPRKRPLPIRIGRRSAASGAAEEETLAGKARAVEEEEEEPLSPAAQLFHQPGFDCCIVAIMGLGKPADVDVIRSGLAATLVRHPRFSSVPVLEESGGAEPRWVRTKVVVENHIVIPDLEDQRRAAASPDQVVEDYVASLTSAPLDRSRPLWDLHVLNFPTSEAAAVAVLRVHHSLGDGTSLMSLLLACTRKASDPHSLPTIPHQSRRPLVSRKLHAGGAFTLLLWLWAFLILAWNTLLDVLRFTATSAFSKDTPTPLTGPKGVEYHPKRIVHRTVSLDDIKDVKNAMHCTVNDVLVGVTSAGLSRYLSRRYGQNVDEHGKKTQLPSNIRLQSTLLVNIRPSPGVHVYISLILRFEIHLRLWNMTRFPVSKQALAELMEGRHSGTKWGNYIGYIILPFSIFKYKDPMDYIRKAKEIAGRKKNSLEAIFTYKSGELIVKCLGIKAGAALCHRVLSNTTLSFSNMIGPVEEVAFYDHPIVYLAPSVYGHPQALTVHFQSYMNMMKMVVTVDDKVIPDARQLLDDFAESLKLIKEAIPTKP